MSVGVVITCGMLCGLAGCVLPARLFERTLQKSKICDVSVLDGIMAIIVSFVFMSLCVFVLYATAQEYILVFGSSTVGAFLVFWGIEAMRAMRAMH